jgi:hypothetical protein
MQVLHAGAHKLLYLELEQEVIEEMAQQLGLEVQVQDDRRALTIDIAAPNRQAPLLLFDASEAGNLGWFARCQFYVDGPTGTVLQTPITVANRKDLRGFLIPDSLRLRIGKELPPNFRLPGKNPVSEQNIYSVLFNFLNALLNTGVAVCGGGVVRPLAGRNENR